MHHPVSGIKSLIHSVSFASHVLTHLLIHLSARLCIIITTLLIHHSFTLSVQAQNLPTFSTNPSHLRLLSPTGLLS